MPTYTLEQRCRLGGTDYAERLVHAIVKHPEITEVITTSVVSAGEGGNWAADLQIVYQAEHELSRNELAAVAQHVPLYLPKGTD